MSPKVLSADALLKRLDAALKAVTDISDFGDAILQPQKFDQFVRRMEDRTIVLPEARFIGMEAQQTDIDRTGFIGRILRSGSDGAGASRTLAEADYAQTTQATNRLTAQELQAITSIRDRALRRNIEREDFESTLIDLFGEAAGRDFEEYALLADTNIPFADDDVLSKTNGWIREAANKVYGNEDSTQSTGARDFDPAAADFPENMFQVMLDALPKRFLQNINEWRLYVPFRILDAYRDRLRSRGTDLGDLQQQEFPTSAIEWKGIPIVFTPIIERSAALPDTTDATLTRDRIEGEVALLGHPDNLAWGVFHEVTIEREREAKDRRTDFVLTFEGDASYEDENAAVAALVDKAHP